MTRLESAIRRLGAQKIMLDWAAERIAAVPGLVLELGLGNGRTYDHLRARLPSREIYVFERHLAAHPESRPPADRLVMGELSATLPAFAKRFGEACTALIHLDIGSGDEAANAQLARGLTPLLVPLSKSSGLILSDRKLAFPGIKDVSERTGVETDRYFAYLRE